MIHFSQLGGYAKIHQDENKDIKYYLKIMDADAYEVSYLFGKHVHEKNILNKEQAMTLINSCISDGFARLTKTALAEHNKNRWGELTLEHYDKIVPETNHLSPKIKI